MKPNRPNTETQPKTFVKLNGLSIVGNYVTQDPALNIPPPTFGRKDVEDIVSTTPSLIGKQGEKGERGDPAQLPTPPKRGIWVLGSVNGKLKWIETEDNCAA